MHRTRMIVAGLATTGLLVTSPMAASAGGHGGKPADPIVRSSELGAPFNLDVATGRVLVADGGKNLVGSLQRDGKIKTIVSDALGASGVATARGGRLLAYTTTDGDQNGINASGLNIKGPRRTIYADTLAFEKANNPDQVNTYGVTEYPDGATAADKKCIDGVFSAFTGSATYTGAIDSHAYSVASYGNGWLVADAGGNDLLRVSRRGRVSALAVFPPQPLVITAAQAAAMDLPKCVVGTTYAFEPVPTDIEVGKDGELYVTTLPGGPEGPALGARGALWRVSERGRIRQIADGFAGATNLAIGKRGEIYVAELFGDKISVVRRGRTSTFAPLTGAVAVEVSPKGTVWAGTVSLTEPPGPGTIVEFKGGRFVKRWSGRH